MAATSYLGLTITAAVPSAWAFVVAVLVVLTIEVLIGRRTPVVCAALDSVGVGRPLRGLLRGLLLVLFAARTGLSVVSIAATVTVLAMTVLRVGRQRLGQLTTHLRQPAALSRNIRLDTTSIPVALWRPLLDPRGLEVVMDVPAATGLAIAASGSESFAAAGLLLSVLMAAVSVLPLGIHVARLRGNGVRAQVVRQIQRQLGQFAPEVVLYFAGGPPASYQLEMWLEPVERLRQRALVIVRDRDVLASLDTTSLPVVCVVDPRDMPMLELSNVRIALYVGNAAQNFDMLRRCGLRSVFVGHGDSDKASSSNSFSRVYDEIWVAGPLGRERYIAADVGVPADRIVEVGRPPLAHVRLDARGADMPVTVLYAPTWEGPDDEPYHTSLSHIGKAIIDSLLAHPGIRVLYRPHPLTGVRDVAVARAHTEIVRLLEAAGAVGPKAAGPSPILAPDAGPADLLDLAKRTGEARPASRADHQSRIDKWTQAYWDAAPRDRHRILTGPALDLFACFAVSDALITDISGVVSDFLMTDRPYAITNASGLPADEFRARYPSSAGGVLVGPDLDGMETFLAAASGHGDPMQAPRREIRLRLLGAVGADSFDRFQAAVDRLCSAPRQG